MDILDVQCRHFEKTLNCSSLKSIPKDIRDACCTENTSEQPSKRLYFSTLMKCCELLEYHGYAPTENRDWENGSYQAYVMGVAVFVILVCLFVSGARSIRRRRYEAMRARQQQQASVATGPDHLPRINTQISLGPPTYGELEASGLTKDYKMGVIDPPAYPGTPEEQEEYLECAVPPVDPNSSENKDENSADGGNGEAEDSSASEPYAGTNVERESLKEDAAFSNGSTAVKPR